VVVSQAEYDSLRAIAKKYENLKRNLCRGGVEEAMLDLLSQDESSFQHSTAQTPAETTEDGGARLDAATPKPSTNFYDRPRATTNGRYSSHDSRAVNHRHHEPPAWVNDEEEAEEDDVSNDDDSPIGGPVGANYVNQQTQRPQFERACTRTIQLMNLAEGVTHAEITAAVRGGLLLDIYLRSNERSATVSFLQAAEARRFFDHVRKHDLYIKNKRVDIKWGDRQFVLPGHVSGKIASGACRNLVVYRYDKRHTEENIREDLDHIHNLVVVKVDFAGGNCYISLNSVHNAINARTCMMSRLKYKGTKIEWGVDECAQPYVLPPPRKEVPLPKKTTSAPANRFHLLNIDDEEEDEIATTFQSKKSVGIAA
ncbi:hypothetical protein B0T17DRAFT_485012, partial [Bombardia bombarda]